MSRHRITFYVLRFACWLLPALLACACAVMGERTPAPEASEAAQAVLAVASASAAVVGDQQHNAAPEPGNSPQPLTLDELLALAFAGNPDMRAAAERLATAEAQVGEAAAAFFPQVSTRLSYSRTDNPAQAFGMILAQRRFTFDTNFNSPGPTHNVRPEIMGAIALFRGGQDAARREAARLGAAATRLEQAALRNALAEAVIAAYYALLSAPEQVEVARQSIEAVEHALEQARVRFAAGAALKSDVLSLEVRLAAALEARLRAENAVELARTALLILIGLPAAAPLEVAGDLAQPEPDLPGAFADALARALADRPELQAAARLVAMRDQEVTAERAAYLPRIDAVGSYGQDATDLELSNGRDNWTVGATAELEVFSGLRTAARVRAAERRLAEARQAERKARLDVEREVKTAFLALEEARQRLRVSEAAVGAAEEALRLVGAQYQAGAANITRYLEAEVARTEARWRAIAARYDTRRAAAALEKAMGAWAGGDQ